MLTIDDADKSQTHPPRTTVTNFAPKLSNRFNTEFVCQNDNSFPWQFIRNVSLYRAMILIDCVFLSGE